MSHKTYIPSGETPPSSQVGATLEALTDTIEARRIAGEESYTYRLLTGSPDAVLKKVMEEAGEVALAAKDVESWACSSLAATLTYESLQTDGACAEAVKASKDGGAQQSSVLSVELPADYQSAVDHLRYEAADVVYHLLVVLARYGVSLDEFAAELNNRMEASERPKGGARLYDEYVKRGN